MMRPFDRLRLSCGLRLAAAAMVAVIGLSSSAPARAQEGILGSPFIGTPAPVPPGSVGVAVPPGGFVRQPLGGDLYAVTDGLYWAMFAVTRDGVIVVDAPPSLGGNLLTAIVEVTSEPITHLVYSHAHVDHIGYAGELLASLPAAVARKVRIIAHEETERLLAEAGDPRRPLPTRTFRRRMKINSGWQRLELSYHGPQHLPGNIYIYSPEQRVLMVVDVIFPGWSPFKALALGQSVRDFIRAHDDILAVDFETLVAGHLTRLGTRQDVATQRQHLDDIRAATGQALGVEGARFASGELYGELVAQYGADLVNPWLLFDRFLQNVNRRCAEAVIPAWRDRLAAVDVFTFSHCEAMNDFLRID